MKTSAKLLLATVLALGGFASLASAKIVGSGKITPETRPVGKFHAVALDGVGQLSITQGDSENLVVETDDNILPLVESKVGSDGVLHLSIKAKEEVRPSKPLVYKLTVKTLDSIALTGSGDIRAGALTADHLDLQVIGSGDVTVDKLDTTGAFKLVLPGSGDVKISGHAASQTVTIDGSGDYDASDLQTGTATLSISGSGDCDVWAKETLAVTINGSGSVAYHGSPVVTKHVAGSGQVRAVNDKKS